MERPESIASWRWEDGEKGTELILEHRMEVAGVTAIDLVVRESLTAVRTVKANPRAEAERKKM